MKQVLFSLFVAILTLNATAFGAEPFPLWDPEVPLPTKEAPLLEGVRFSVVKAREPEVDGYNWLHGMAAVWHKGELVTFWGHNKGDENTPTEQARERRSADGGLTWGPVRTIASHTETEGRSHGVLLSHDGELWAFLARFGQKYLNTRTEAFLFNEDADPQVWESKRIVVERFWPCDEPRRMADGNWIMAGMDVEDGGGWAQPAVAISHGHDFTQWDLVRVPVDESMNKIWGESTVIVAPEELLIVVRAGGRCDYAIASTSRDFGRTWDTAQWTNLPMACTKVYGGALSTGQRFLIGTTVADHGNKRHPLTIALTRPGETQFSQIFRIRNAVFPDGPGESGESVALSYPYAVEHEGHLYVVYSNDGGRGRNRNSGEMAVIPLSAFQTK